MSWPNEDEKHLFYMRKAISEAKSHAKKLSRGVGGAGIAFHLSLLQARIKGIVAPKVRKDAGKKQ